MKKVVLMVLLGSILAAGTVFAQHPEGLGIGFSGHGGFYWSEDVLGLGRGNGGVALSLKIPSVPVYWGIKFDFANSFFRMNLQGDYYIFDQSLWSGSGLNLGWYLGLGGYFSFLRYSVLDAGMNGFGFGVRVPLGLDLTLLNNKLDVFVEMAPAFGLGFWPDAPDPAFFDGGMSFSLGGRVWL
jgi:hypothetical protein